MLVASPIAKTVWCAICNRYNFASVLHFGLKCFNSELHKSLCEQFGGLEGGEVISQKACGRKSYIYIYSSQHFGTISMITGGWRLKAQSLGYDPDSSHKVFLMHMVSLPQWDFAAVYVHMPELTERLRCFIGWTSCSDIHLPWKLWSVRTLRDHQLLSPTCNPGQRLGVQISACSGYS